MKIPPPTRHLHERCAAALLDPAEQRRIVRFVVAGASNTLISLCVYLAIVGILRHGATEAAVAQLASYCAGILWSYFLNRHWVFGGSAPADRPVFRFIFVQVVLMAASAALVALATDRFSASATAIWFSVMSVITLANYLLLRLWVFTP